MGNVVFISVILPLKLEWEPCYAVPQNLHISIGDRVRVRFANKEYAGVVSNVDITPEIPSSRIQEITSVDHDLEKILPSEMELWRHVAEYYLCTIGEVYKAAYPLVKINLEEAKAAAIRKTIQRKEKIADSIKARIRRIEARIEKKEEQKSKARKGTKTEVTLMSDLTRLAKEKAMAEEALEAVSSDIESATEGNIRKGPVPENRIRLTEAQGKAYNEILDTFDHDKPVLLHGVTGAGKTEIYIKLAHEAIVEGKNVLYLVPEIALSRQLEERLREHFGDRVLTYHSGESSASRRNTSETIRSTGGNLILGTRSALFLPLQSLGLIIVDEEHDSSYKQDSPAPRYNGRDTALMLHKIHKCNIVLGSATPSLEELYNCAVGRHVKVELKKRYHDSQNVDVELIDTKSERRKNGMTGSFSRKLIAHIEETLRKGRQVLILRSRRSWAPLLQCEDCGEILKCRHCNVSLNMHKNGKTEMLCHYCGYSEPYTGICPECNGKLVSIGAGTQKIEEEAANLFPDARIARLDSDTTQHKSYGNRIIRDFSRGDIDILIGTQMITKGFDFERLNLVAVIAADSLLGMQDFRADEKALQLLEQFRGRCGRRHEKGLIVIQTAQPGHQVYQRLLSGHNDIVHSGLMQERKDFGFPPYTRIMEIIIKDIYEDRLHKMSGHLAHFFSETLSDHSHSASGTVVTGPYAPVVDKVAGQYIRMIRISLRKGSSLTSEKQSVKDVIGRFEKQMKYDGHIVVNVDPA